jgi:hypothetical protein
MIEQGGTVKRAFNAINGTIDNMTTTIVFSSCKPNPCREIAKEQYPTNYNFIYSCGRDLRTLNHEVVPARRVFRHAGMDVSSFGFNGSRPIRSQDLVKLCHVCCSTVR